MSSAGFYRAFEERHRGSRELIRERLKVYLPFVEPLRQAYEPALALDVGCGRGEWLELIRDAGFEAHGIDLDAGMLQACIQLGLSVQQGDGIAYLSSLGDETQCVVSGFHVAEHIPFDQLDEFIVQALRVLKPGGLLILETPNPENLVVGASSFFLDPSHLRPIPPALLAFIPEYHGFARLRILRLQEDPALHTGGDVSLMNVLGDASPDYAVVAQKAAAPELLARFDAAFAAHHGIELHELATRYDEKLGRRMSAIESRLGQAEARQDSHTDLLTRLTSVHDRLVDSLERRTHAAEARASAAEARAQEVEARAQEAEMRARETGSGAQLLEARVVQLEMELGARDKELHGVHQANHYHWQQWECAKQELQNVHHANHNHRQLAETGNQALADVYRSLSWRITAPLRFAGGLFIHPGVTLRNSANRAIHYTIQTGQRPLSRLMVAVLQRPQLAQRISQFLMRYPALRQHLLSVARQQGVVPGATAYAIPKRSNSEHADPALDQFTPHARQVYADLKTAIRNTKRID